MPGTLTASEYFFKNVSRSGERVLANVGFFLRDLIEQCVHGFSHHIGGEIGVHLFGTRGEPVERVRKVGVVACGIGSVERFPNRWRKCSGQPLDGLLLEVLSASVLVAAHNRESI